MKPKTVASYESLLKTAVLPAWGTTRLDRITASAVRTWVANMTGGRGTLLCASRRRQAYNLLTAMLDAAVEDEEPGEANHDRPSPEWLPAALVTAQVEALPDPH